jgi:uncharacterized protein
MPDGPNPSEAGKPRKPRQTRSKAPTARKSVARSSSSRATAKRSSTTRAASPRASASRTTKPRTTASRASTSRSAQSTVQAAAPTAPPTAQSQPLRQADAKSRAPVTSAGYALAVGVICFALWTLFDARQLFNSANASPLGARRSASMTFLRPIMRFEDFFGIDRFVDGGNRALGRNGTPTLKNPGGSPTPPVTSTTVPASTTTTTPPQITAALPPIPPHITATAPNRTPVGVAKTRPRVSGPPPLVQPTAKRPLVILDVGDSIGEDLGYGLDEVIGSSRLVRLELAAQESTGLVDEDYFNWPAHLAADIQAYHPRLVVVMLGANDWNGLLQNGVGYQAGSAPWRRVYAQRVAQMMSEATSSGARVLWVGMPIMQSPSFSADMEVVNAIFEKEAALHPGVVYVPTWRLFSTRSGHFLTYISGPQGLVQVRASDGIHIALPGGGEYIGSYVVSEIEHHFHVRI